MVALDLRSQMAANHVAVERMAAPLPASTAPTPWMR